MEIVPFFTPLGTTAGILHEITRHMHETQRDELPPAGSVARGAMLGGLVGLAADIGLQGAGRRARARERAKSGKASGPSTSRSGRTGGEGMAAAGIQGSSSGMMRASHRRSGKSGGQ